MSAPPHFPHFFRLEGKVALVTNGPRGNDAAIQMTLPKQQRYSSKIRLAGSARALHYCCHKLATSRKPKEIGEFKWSDVR